MENNLQLQFKLSALSFVDKLKIYFEGHVLKMKKHLMVKNYSSTYGFKLLKVNKKYSMVRVVNDVVQGFQIDEYRRCGRKATYIKYDIYPLCNNESNYYNGIFAKLDANVQMDIPIFFVDKEEINIKIKQELKKLGVEKVYLIGEKDLLTNKIVNELKELNIKYKRIYGKNNFETSIKIAEKMEEKLEKIRELVKEIKSYEDEVFLYECDRINLEIAKNDLWELLQTM